MNSIFDNWAQGVVVVLQTAGGVITGTIANIGTDLISLSNATINGIAVTLANVRISDILAAGLVPSTTA